MWELPRLRGATGSIATVMQAVTQITNERRWKNLEVGASNVRMVRSADSVFSSLFVDCNQLG